MTHVVIAVVNEVQRRQLKRELTDADFLVEEALDGLALVKTVFEFRPDAVILDLLISEIEGLELLKMLRAASDMPILALAPRADPDLSVRALDLGADDVLPYSTSPHELVARLRATLRRAQQPVASVDDRSMVRTGEIEIDRIARVVRKGGEYISLTRTEYKLLDALATRVGQVAPHRFLLTTVWGDAAEDDTHYLRVYIGYLRNKLEDDPGVPVYLVNEWGMGYRLALFPAGPPPRTRRDEFRPVSDADRPTREDVVMRDERVEGGR